MMRCALAAVLSLALTASPAFAGEDSPWPEDGSNAAGIRAAAAVVRNLEARVERMQLSADRYARWDACLRAVGVSEYGDPDRQSGYGYDERDGTGVGPMPALAVDRRRPAHADYHFIAVARDRTCTSDAPVPGGTADAAAAHRPRLRELERRVVRLKRKLRRVSAAADRFDAWESCVSWVPVTEYGDPDGRFGYLFGALGGAALSYRPALAIDRSEWDDPDYMVLAFVGSDRPGHSCQDEPGEGVD
jgi:hypothetical protein